MFQQRYNISKLLFIMLLWLQFSGCCGCGKNEADPANCLSIVSVTLTAYNNADSIPVSISNNQDVIGEALMLELNLNNHKDICYRKPPVNLLFSTANATSCGYTQVYNHIDSVVSMSIITDKDFDKTHPAGSELNDLFFLPETWKLNDDIEDISVKIYAQHSPEQTGRYTFTAKLFLESGRVLEASTEPVNLVR